MYNPQKTEVSQESYAILNAIRNESDIFRTSTPLVEDADSMRAFGEFVTGAGQYKELFWGILVNRITLTVVSGREFKNKLAQFRRGKIGLGDIVQNIWVGLVLPSGWSSDVSSPGDVYRTNKPDAKVSMSAVNCKLSYEVTSNDTELGYAFVQENGLYNLVSKIAERLITSEEVDDYIMMKWVIAKNLLNALAGNAGSPIKTIDPIENQTTADNAVRAMKEVVNDFPFMKTKYNEAGVPSPCPTDEIVFITTSKSRASLDVLALSKAFNLTYEQFLGQEVQIDEFGFDEFSLERLYNILDEQVALGLIPEYDEFTEDELNTLNSLACAIMDRDWFMSFDKVYEMNNIYDVLHLNNNSFLVIHRIYSYNPFVNCVFFKEEEQETTYEVQFPSPVITVDTNTETIPLMMTVHPLGGTLAIRSSDETVATVEVEGYQGAITIVGAGATILTAAYTVNGQTYFDNCYVTVTEAPTESPTEAPTEAPTEL